MKLIKDLGMLFPTKNSKKKKRYGIYECSCGKEFKTQTACIKNGHVKSCGCYKKQILVKRNTTHANSNTRLYKIWKNIITRTTNNSEHYKNYSGRGIKVCDKWKSFKPFYEWSINNGYSDELSIDRINNDGNYEPDNCRWTTVAIQNRNTRKIRIDNTSGFRGVSFNKSSNKWIAYINVDYKRDYLGLFDTAEHAAQAYDTFVIVHRLEHTRNFT